MTANQSDSLQNLLAKSKAQRRAVDELTVKIKEYTLNYKKLSEQTDRRLKELSEQAKRDRQQAEQERQQAAIDRQAWQEESRRVWEYLLRKSGDGKQDS